MTDTELTVMSLPASECKWIACEHPERPASIGTAFHLREQDLCRPCAVAWLVAREFIDFDEAEAILTQRALAVLGAGHG